MRGSSPVPPAQGGFLVIRPSLETFRELQAIIRKGDHGSGGWGGSGIGNFWGGQTIQGIVPYFYHSVHKGQGLELNRCVYNCMVDNPYRPNTNICLDKTGKTCQDCRLQKIENVKSAHFTICQKPWTCTEHTNPKYGLNLYIHLFIYTSSLFLPTHFTGTESSAPRCTPSGSCCGTNLRQRPVSTSPTGWGRLTLTVT